MDLLELFPIRSAGVQGVSIVEDGSSLFGDSFEFDGSLEYDSLIVAEKHLRMLAQELRHQFDLFFVARVKLTPGVQSVLTGVYSMNSVHPCLEIMFDGTGETDDKGDVHLLIHLKDNYLSSFIAKFLDVPLYCSQSL